MDEEKDKNDESSIAVYSSGTSSKSDQKSGGTEAGDGAMSDISEDLDCFECKASVDTHFDCVTVEDKDLRIAETIASHLRASVLVPPDGLQKDAASPMVHCAFQCCSWSSNGVHFNDTKLAKLRSSTASGRIPLQATVSVVPLVRCLIG